MRDLRAYHAREATLSALRALQAVGHQSYSPEPSCSEGEYRAFSVQGHTKIALTHFRVPKTLTFQTRLKNLSCKNTFIYIRMKNHFHINSFALSLALKQRHAATCDWPTQVNSD